MRSILTGGLVLVAGLGGAGCGGTKEPPPAIVAHAGLEQIKLYIDGLA